MSVTAAASSSPLRGILCMVLSVFMLSCSDALTKWLGGSYPPGEVICLRAAFSLMPVCLMVALRGGLASLRVVDRRGQAARAVAFAAATSLIALSMILLPLADAAAILYSGPLFITAFAAPMLGERIGWRRWAAVFVGFIGILVMLRPSAGAFQPLGLLPLCAAVAASLRDIYSRRLTGTETSNSMMFWASLAVALIAGLSAFFGWVPVAPGDLLLLAVAGSIIGAAQYVMIEGYRAAQAALLAPFKYSGIVWAASFGFLVWGDVPDRFILTGGAIVIACGLYILHRETRRGPA